MEAQSVPGMAGGSIDTARHLHYYIIATTVDMGQE